MRDSKSNPYFEEQSQQLHQDKQFKSFYGKPKGAKQYIQNIRKSLKSQSMVPDGKSSTIYQQNTSEELSNIPQVPVKNMSRITLGDLQMISERNKAVSALSILSDASETRSHLKYNRKVISMLKQANVNLKQYKKIVNDSPSKPKMEVVKELHKGVEFIRRSHSRKSRASLNRSSSSKKANRDLNLGIRRDETILSSIRDSSDHDNSSRY